MSIDFIEERRTTNPIGRSIPREYVHREERRTPIQHGPSRLDSVDAERNFIARAVNCFWVLGVAPLILFHLFNFLFSEMLLTSISPN